MADDFNHSADGGGIAYGGGSHDSKSALQSSSAKTEVTIIILLSLIAKLMCCFT